MNYSPWGHKESDTTEQVTHTHTHTHKDVHVNLWYITLCDKRDFVDENRNFEIDYSGNRSWVNTRIFVKGSRKVRVRKDHVMIETERERKCDDENRGQMMWVHEPRNGEPLEAGKDKETYSKETIEGTKPW